MSKLKDLYISYCNWIATNPTKVSEVEKMFTWGSMAFFARSGSNILPELLYSTSHLITLHNDIVILQKPFLPGATLKIWLTVVEYCEVLLEVTAFRKGKCNRSIVIYLIQMIKCLGRLYLIRSHNEFLITIPPFQPIDRNAVDENEYDYPRRKLRTYHQSAAHESKIDSLFENNESYLQVMKTIRRAEIIYTLKPLIHLLSMSHYGKHSWKPWLISLLLEVISNRMLYKGIAVLPKKRTIIIDRYMRLFLYLLRSPLYETIIRTPAIAKLIDYLAQMPIFGYILKIIFACVPNYRECYFYLWSH